MRRSFAAAIPGLVALALLAGGCSGTGGADARSAATGTPPPALARPGPATVQELPSSLVGKEWERLPTTSHVVALTFDACGNDAGAASILSTLQAKSVRATFFVCGRWGEAYPEWTKTIASRYPVGNHSYSHPHLPQLSDAAVVAEVEDGAQVLSEAAQVDARPLFRFPYGDRDARTIGIVNGLGYGSIRWTVDTLGWEGESGGQSAASVRSRVLGALQPGEIVLMHVGAANDGTTLDADALAGVIDAVRARGYTLTDVYRYAARFARVVDDGTARFSALSGWRRGSWSPQRYGSGYHYASPKATFDPARFRLRIPQTASFKAYGWWPASASYNGAARIALETRNGRSVVVVDERLHGGRWVSLGTFSFRAGDRWAVSVLRRSARTGLIIADAFRITSVTSP